MEYEKLRGLRESEEELAKVQAHIDKMVAKNIKKFQDEKKQQELACKEVEYHYPTLQELVRLNMCNCQYWAWSAVKGMFLKYVMQNIGFWISFRCYIKWLRIYVEMESSISNSKTVQWH